jgi:hypothetical protein
VGEGFGIATGATTATGVVLAAGVVVVSLGLGGVCGEGVERGADEGAAGLGVGVGCADVAAAAPIIGGGVVTTNDTAPDVVFTIPDVAGGGAEPRAPKATLDATSVAPATAKASSSNPSERFGTRGEVRRQRQRRTVRSPRSLWSAVSEQMAT